MLVVTVVLDVTAGLVAFLVVLFDDVSGVGDESSVTVISSHESTGASFVESFGVCVVGLF